MAIDAVSLLCEAHGLPAPEREVCFHPERKWRVDYVWQAQRVILEVDGGIARGGNGGGTALGGHSSIGGILRDIEKANAAQLLGYRYLRVTPRMVQEGNYLLSLLQVVLRDQH